MAGRRRKKSGGSITYQIKEDNFTSQDVEDTIYKLQKRIEDENHRQNKRIEVLEKITQQINSLTVSVEKLAQSIELMVSEQKQQGKRLETLESRDGDMWRTAVKYVLTTALGLVLGAAAMKFGLK